MLDLDDLEGVRGREEKRLRFKLVSTLNELGASESRFSSSDPFRMLLGGSDGRCDMLEDDDAAEADEGERETDKIGSTADLPFGDELRRAASWPRLTQLLSLRNSIPGRLTSGFLGSSSGSSCSITTYGCVSRSDEAGFSSVTAGIDCVDVFPGGADMILEGGNAPSRTCTGDTSFTDGL